LPALIAGADWVVMPSVWWENAPLVIQEAFLHRRPVIASAIGGMAEMVKDGVNGLLVPPDDPIALAAAMRRAATEPGLWRRLKAGIATPITVAQAARAHLALYRKLGVAAPAKAGRRAA
jgi:glycosyltransferase involved in cell wall biosynthesis